MQNAFPLPDMSLIDDAIANGTFRPPTGHAQAARAVHRRAGRLFARAPASLHRDRARARPALHPADQLPALRRALHRLRRAGDPGERRLRRPSSSPATWSRPTARLADQPAAGRRRASAADAGLPSDPARADGRHHGQHRHRAFERPHDHRSPGRAAAALLADARPLRGPAPQPAPRRLRAGPRLCPRGPRARPRPAADVPVPPIAEVQVALQEAVVTSPA